MAPSRKRLVLVLGVAAACLAFAGVMIPRSLRGPSQIATVDAPPADEASGVAAPQGAAERIVAALADAPSSRQTVAPLFHWSEERAADKTIEELWKEEDMRPSQAAAPQPLPESRPLVSPEDLARVRAIVVKGVVVGPKGSTALLSTGRVRVNDVIPGSQFKVAAIDAQAVTLIAADERVVLPAAASRPGRVRSHQR